MTYWQIARPLIMTGMGLPFFFVPLTALALGSVEEREMASAAGLQNFLRTLSGAFATSIVNTVWENRANMVHAEWVGDADRSGDVVPMLGASGMSPDGSRENLDHLLSAQSVMVATNQIMLVLALVFAISALVMWFAPRPSRAVSMSQAGH
jgi:DHA2 family multidrug resistance protein